MARCMHSMLLLRVLCFCLHSGSQQSRAAIRPRYRPSFNHAFTSRNIAASADYPGNWGSGLCMGWRRLPTLLAHVPLRTLPLSEQAQKTLEQTGHVSELAFKTIPSIGKVLSG